MLAAERHLKIIEMVQEYGSAQVEELARELKVTPMTIRRDLVKLQKDGVLDRCHGGAVAKKEVTYADKQNVHHDEKTKLALKCIEKIQDGDTIYLDAGTSTYEIARELSKFRDLMVVTNDLEIACYLKDSDVDLILCGGYVQKSTGSMLGYYATSMMKEFRFDVGFFGAASINEKFQVLTPTIDKAFLKRQLVGQCRESFLVVDDSKFGKQAMNQINHLADYTGVITNHIFKPGEKKQLEEMGAELIIIE